MEAVSFFGTEMRTKIRKGNSEAAAAEEAEHFVIGTNWG
jgi:hypothetical protein